MKIIIAACVFFMTASLAAAAPHPSEKVFWLAAAVAFATGFYKLMENM